MSLHPRTDTTNRYPAFQQLLGNTSGQSVLDFGGNRGNLLYFSDQRIDAQKYTCVDVDLEALHAGRDEFPQATWIPFHRRNPMYNHHGSDAYNMPSVESHDIVWAYSVFSHTTIEEFIITVKWLLTKTKKTLCVSFLNSPSVPLVSYFNNKRIEQYGDCHSFNDIYLPTTKTAYVIDNEAPIINQPETTIRDCNQFIAFYEERWLLEQFASHGVNISIDYHNHIPYLIVRK